MTVNRRLEHQCSSRLRRSAAIHVILAGVGGTGSRLLVGLKQLHFALRALGWAGLQVSVFDPDRVSPTNLARQAFAPSDVGIGKATVLVHRLNLAYGLSWSALELPLNEATISRAGFGYEGLGLIVSAVDTRNARAEIAQAAAQTRAAYWLDTGVEGVIGQFVLGEPLPHRTPTRRQRLPTAAELFPALADTSIPETDTPSCSAQEALEHQDLFVNEAIAVGAQNLLWRLLHFGRIGFHGGFVNCETGVTRPLEVNPKIWARLRKVGEARTITVKTGGNHDRHNHQ